MNYDWDENPELNITPLVDVMLVLLAILMVIAPTVVYEELIKLPSGSAQKAISKKPPVNITINHKKEILLKGEKFKFKGFEDNFYLFAQDKLDTKAAVLISADKRLSYGEVMMILGAVKRAGFTEVSLATNG
ncbi:biopolymer transporter ExbD [Sulfurimonas sp. MAG313]|nr:biopolymer transporter ExbD [Sulfurimonas sp. MAG313]MDF1881934.1 biopolymer transporter ExbD [Sulfurimonas sp. MAG313]